MGRVPLVMQDGKVKHLEDVLHVPTITKNLVSVGQMVDQGLQVRFNSHGVFVEDLKNKCKLVTKGEKKGRLFTLDVTMPSADTAMYVDSSRVINDIDIWHKRIGHANMQRLKSMQSSGVVTGLPKFKDNAIVKVCAACQFGKQARHRFMRHEIESSKPLEIIHSDVWTADTMTIGGCYYFVTFIDDYSRKVWVYFMKAKSEVFGYFQEFKAMVEKETGLQIKCLQSDNGGEYTSHAFSDFLKRNGIVRHKSCRFTPQQNGVVERKNRHIAEVARALMNERQIPNEFWGEAVSTAIYIINRTPTAAVHNVTPEERYSGKKPDISHLKVFGCICYVHVPDELRTKLDAKAEKCIFLGYSLEHKGYRCYNPMTRKLRISCDVVFDELASWYALPPIVVDDGKSAETVDRNPTAETVTISGPSEASSSSSTSPWSGRLRNSADKSGSAHANSPRKGKEKIVEQGDTSRARGESSDSDMSLDEELGIPRLTTPGVRKSTRVRYPVDRLTYDGMTAIHYAYMVKVLEVPEPTIFEDAMGNAEWESAMDEEMDALDANKTWELVDLPAGKKPIGCKWVYKVKRNSDGSVSRYKARLVAKGYAQEYGIDYEETFSPVAKMSTVRCVIALAASKGWSLHQMDVKNAFLHGDLHEEVYMEQPQGYVHPQYPQKVCKLVKALYGLKQAPRQWFEKISGYLISIGFQVSPADPSLFVRKSAHGMIMLVLYVDDLILTGDSVVEICEIKQQLGSRFEMKDLGELRYFLGIEVIRSTDGIWLMQRQYALDMLSRFGMTGCKPITTPLEVNGKLTQDGGELIDDVTMYRCMVGSLIYMTITRPDLSYAVGLVSQFMQSPRKPHLDSVRRIMRYVKSTIQYGLFYAYGSDLHLSGYTDADWAGSPYDRRSTSGYSFTLGSGAVSWSSKKQPTVALSSTEAEYRGAALAACEIDWLCTLLHSLDIVVDYVVVLYCDNMSSIKLSSNPVFHARAKHIEVHYHFIREKVIAGEIDLQHVSTTMQVADIFTKSLGTEKFQQFRNSLGVMSIDVSLRGSVEISSSKSHCIQEDVG